jgi:putative acetyltransferase
LPLLSAFLLTVRQPIAAASYPDEVALTIAVDDPRSAGCITVLKAHLEHTRRLSPPEHVHALDIEGLLHPAVTFFSAREGDTVLGVGALKELDSTQGEVKSMHTLAAARGQGVGRAMLEHLLGVAAERYYERVSLETGTMDGFGPARTLYASVGFVVCEPFAQYTVNPYSVCMTLDLTQRQQPGRQL